MPEGSIRAHRIWKRFRADRRRMLLRDELERLRARMRGVDVGWRWALRDVSLELEPGESVGLVGINGSGKSTLLKILSRVMYPHTGTLDISGRVGALIEVRAGIHPDLSGRENVFLYGSLLGLSRREVAARFDEIVAFAELEGAIDRQVKFYSSGMQMRLGFAVAAFLEPDVLLVDEVLAVGDASFQQRCLERMRHVLSEGTTLVFVSHDLAAVEATCSRGVWLHGGVLQADGPVSESIGRYRGFIEEAARVAPVEHDGPVRLLKVSLDGGAGRPIQTQGSLAIRAAMECDREWAGTLAIGVSEGPATPIFVLRRDVHLPAGTTEIGCTVERLPLPRGRFFLWTGLFDLRGRDELAWHPAGEFTVDGPDLDAAPRSVVRLAPVHVAAQWELGRE